MAQFQARKISGPWTSGYVLDLHTISSTLIGHDEFGHPQFDTKHSEIGDLLYRLKYRNDKSAIPELVDSAAALIRRWGIEFSAVVPVPPTKTYRSLQPVITLASEIAGVFKVPVLKSDKESQADP
jgi:competence protein ComFC